MQKFYNFCLDHQIQFGELNKRRKTHCIFTFSLFLLHPALLPSPPGTLMTQNWPLQLDSLLSICWCVWVWAESVVVL